MEGVQPLNENLENARGRRFPSNKLWLVVSVIQGLGLLLCLTYVFQHFYASQMSPQNPPIESIQVRFTKCENKKGFIITSTNSKTMKVQNNSVIINCDGFYLVSLKGFFSQNISIHLYYRNGADSLFFHDNVKFVNSATVAYLAYKDKVYFDVVTHNATCEDIQVNGGELILIHQSPGEYCVN
ncbi:Tumor necrosis factor ligand superfamily member 4 [Galemys pyrenaicus]|uniref:Tumor necrosis factor ligand superfamily member 4 n=1 Tax=Galemys pyrenaicus TaxID=202257 RepID=A0A8J6AB30_GALPY|nr:Tumor necrosis factor ligand superfamily member 4 [Galemys pyrenaicus]